MQTPYGSSLNDPNVQAALTALAQMQPAQDPETRPAPHPRDSNLNDPAVASSLQGMAQQQAQPPIQLATVKNALNGGELSPDMQARYDLPRYQTGCEKLLNMIPLPGGGITRRPGFSFVSGTGTEQGVAARLLPFVYSTDIALMLMFLGNSGGGQLYILDRDGKEGARKSCLTPYKNTELATLSFCQCGKVLYLAHPAHKPAKLVFDGSDFSYEKLDFGNKTPIPSIASLEIVGIPNEAWGWRRYKVTAVNDETGEESLPSKMQELPTSALNASFKCKITINPVPSCSEYRIYKQRGAEYGFIGRITEGGTEFEDEGYTPDTADQPPDVQNFFQQSGDYPAIVFLHQQRLGWAATDNNPLTIWLSQSSNFECLAAKTPPQDDDGIEATLASTQANRILWCASDRTGLAIGTAGEEWYLTGANGESAITPNSLSFQPQTRYGSQNGTDATRANSSLIFVQRGGRVVRDLGYAFQSDRYEAQDLTLLARHIFQDRQIADVCWQGSPFNILWLVDSKGELEGLTYMPEQEIIAWHRHKTASDILSCATLDDSEGRSRLWIVTHYSAKGQAHVELLGLPYDLAAQFTDGQGQHPYQARCIPCLPESGMENGATTMRVKKINAIKAKVLNSAPFTCQVTGIYSPDGGIQKVPPAIYNFNQKDKDNLTRQNYVSGVRDWACPIGAGFRDGAKLELIFDEPKPVTVLGLTIVMEVATEAGGQI